jgi:hypothetical protein
MNKGRTGEHSKERGVTRKQLEVLKDQSVLVLEESAKFVQAGGDVSKILPSVAKYVMLLMS